MVLRSLILLFTLLGVAHAAAPSVEEGRGHWAFQPLSKVAPPVVKQTSWPRTEVDRYILAKLEATGLQPSVEAAPAVLIRRAYLDLIGLLPSPEEVTAFEKACATAQGKDQAYEAMIDHLLASPHYGERWGRHWLDLARYADTGGIHNDLDRPHAWKYRDYVIRSFNEDKPYARFVAEQLAGDEVDGANEESLIATGFCRNGQSNDDNMGKNAEALAQYRADQMDDIITTTGSVFLGLTIGCARCHDHKTDPLLQRDYYSLFAVFNGTEKVGMGKGAKDKDDKDIKDASQVMALIERSPKVPPTHVLLRGLAANKGDLVPPAVPTVLTPAPLAFTENPQGKTSLRRRTLAEWITSPSNAIAWRVLANRVWQHHFGTGIVASPSNFGFTGSKPTHPELLDYLAAQLLANGGKLKPLHKLIMMSAVYRQSSGEEPRAKSEEIKASDGSREASASTPLALCSSLDPTNALLWRMNKQRMEAEILRDNVLVASGKLNLKPGGPGIKPRIRADLLDASQRNKWPVLKEESAEQWRRSVYIYIKRQLLMPGMELFDAPTTTDSCAQRLASTVPTQALVMMNDEFVEDQAGFLAARASRDTKDDATVVQRLFMITLGHSPSEERLKQAMTFLNERSAADGHSTALRDLAHVLLNSSEFITIE